MSSNKVQKVCHLCDRSTSTFAPRKTLGHHVLVPTRKSRNNFFKVSWGKPRKFSAKKDLPHNLSPTLQAQRCKIGKNEGCSKKMRISSQAFTK